MTTAAQAAANRENGKKSKGPKTQEGKNRSRCNAFVDGLAGKGVVMTEIDFRDYEQRARSCTRRYGPTTTWRLCTSMASLMSR